MHTERFFDQTLELIQHGYAAAAVPMLAGKLYHAYGLEQDWIKTQAALHKHLLHAVLLEDPYCARAALKPRGYAGDAVLIDYLYDRSPPQDTSELGKNLFDATTNFQASQGVRQRREFAAELLAQSYTEGHKICVLACGHFREGDNLAGEDLSNITLVDQDALSLLSVIEKFGKSPVLEEANVFRFLKSARASGQRYDLIYTLGLTDYLDDRAMLLLHKLAKDCLSPDGTFLLANFVSHHLAVGWMEAVMDWHLIYRTEEDLAFFAREAGMKSATWRDTSGSIAWCKMQIDHS